MSLLHPVNTLDVIHVVADTDSQCETLLYFLDHSRRAKRVNMVRGKSGEYHLLIRVNPRQKSILNWQIGSVLELAK